MNKYRTAHYWVRKTDIGQYVVVTKDSAGQTVMAINFWFDTREAAEYQINAWKEQGL